MKIRRQYKRMERGLLIQDLLSFFYCSFRGVVRCRADESELAPISGYQRSTRSGDITPRIMDDWGK